MADMTEWIAGLRAIADLAEAKPEAFNPYSTFHVNLIVDTAEEMAVTAKTIGGHFDKYDDGAYFNLRKTLGPHTLDVCASHQAVCERVEVGTETVEVPDPDAPRITVERPLYEWKCPESILASVSE